MTTIDERIFAHLHVHTEFSLCIGVARIKEYMAAALNNEINDEYIKEAKRLGIKFLPADNKKVIVNLEWKRMEYAFLC